MTRYFRKHTNATAIKTYSVHPKICLLLALSAITVRAADQAVLRKIIQGKTITTRTPIKKVPQTVILRAKSGKNSFRPVKNGRLERISVEAKRSLANFQGAYIAKYLGYVT